MIARRTGMTATQVVEEALRAYQPPADGDGGGRLIRKGAILVKPANGKTVTLEEANATLDEVRDTRG